MNFESIDDIIIFAIEREREAVEFYDGLSRDEKFLTAKKSFAEFADQEKKHVKLLENFAANKENLEKYDFKWIPDMKRSDYMVDTEYEKGMAYLEILRIAMKREEHALKLYNELQAKTDDEAFIKLFKILSQEEAKHKSILETIYDDHMAELGD